MVTTNKFVVPALLVYALLLLLGALYEFALVNLHITHKPPNGCEMLKVQHE